jgi:hypothetical protein
MTDAETQVKSALVSAGGLVALVGDRIDPDEISAKSVLPAVTFDRGDSAPEYGLDNTLYASKVTMNVTAWAKTRLAANAVADAVVAAMLAVELVQSSRASAYEPELDEYAVVLGFEVWEI